jgi:DNA-binding NarL/FixJ family response regulator
VLVVEEHQVYREVLSLVLRAHEGIEVIGHAADGRAAIDAARRLHPDIAIMDVSMPGLNGIEVTRQLRRQSPGTRVVILSALKSRSVVAEALRAGASAYLTRRCAIAEVVSAIRAIRQGGAPFFSEDLLAESSASDYVTLARNPDPTFADPLTGREREVLQLVAEGYSNQGIADALFISVKTVEAHRAHIMSKLGARHRTDLICYAISRNLIRLKPDDRLHAVA